jgi:N-acetylglucosaminyl-diphospho-decaprenol L-rhamnosyltransferase
VTAPPEASASASEASPRVSVIIIAHSVRAELARCLSAIAENAGVATEAILVDNASTDGTVAWARRAHPDVEVVELDRNEGVAAREHGLRRASAPYTMFLDSDAFLTSGALPRMVAALDEHPEWGLLGPKLVYEDGTLQLSCRRFPPILLPVMRRPPLSRFLEDSEPVRHHLMADADHSRTRPVLYVLGACQLFRSELARTAGHFGRRFYWPEDADWCFRIRDAGGQIVYFPEATVIHSYRRLSNAKPVSRLAWEHLKGFYALQWKYRHRRREFVRLAAELDRMACE